MYINLILNAHLILNVCIELAKTFIQFFCKMLLKNPNKQFGQLTICISMYTGLPWRLRW